MKNNGNGQKKFLKTISKEKVSGKFLASKVASVKALQQQTLR